MEEKVAYLCPCVENSLEDEIRTNPLNGNIQWFHVGFRGQVDQPVRSHSAICTECLILHPEGREMKGEARTTDHFCPPPPPITPPHNISSELKFQR